MVLYAKDILEKDFLSLADNTSVYEAAMVMDSTKHGFAIIGPPTRPEGIVTEWDILSKVVAKDKNPREVTLAEIMTKELIFVKVNESIATVSQIMSERGIRRLLVEDRGKVVGVITAKMVLANLNAYVDKVSTQISRLQAPWF